MTAIKMEASPRRRVPKQGCADGDAKEHKIAAEHALEHHAPAGVVLLQQNGQAQREHKLDEHPRHRVQQQLGVKALGQSVL